MKPATPALKALLASRQFYYADLYTFQLANGSNLYYTTGDQNISFGGITYLAGGTDGPIFDRQGNRALAHWKVGTQVDTLAFDCMPRNGTIGGLSFLQACQQGVFDGAIFTLQRAFMPNYGNTAAGTVIVFFGRIAEIDAGRSIATFNVNSHLELFNQNMPRNVYQASCVNTLYDTSCSLLKAAFTVAGAVVGASTASVVNTNLSQANGYFNLGVITFTSGINAGIAKSVKTFSAGTPGVINTLTPLPNPPAPGDTFTIYPGCDKTMPTCQNTFNNLANFRGMPFVPEVSTAV